MSTHSNPDQIVNTQYNADKIDARIQIFPDRIELGGSTALSIARPENLGCPSLPAAFLRRERHFDKICQNVAKNELKFCVVTGASGSGKTSTVIDVFVHPITRVNFVGTWIDCRQVVTSDADIALPNSVSEKNLIVLDFLNDENHALLTSGFIELSHTDLQAVATSTFGYPQFCQMINDIIVSEECDCAEILGSARPNGSADTLARVLTYWLSACLKSALAEAIVKCLLHIPFIGLDLSSVSQILGEPEEQLSRHMDRLVRVGIVSSVHVLFEGGRDIFYLHDIVRNLREYLTADENVILDWRTRYMRQLQKQLSAGPTTNGDVIRSLDAWISGWAFVFQSNERANDRPNEFLERLNIHEQMLPRILPSISSCFKQADQLAFVLKPYIHQKMNCSPLTGLGHLLRDVEPNYLVADIMWNAVLNYDGWGRASALGVCVAHWARLGDSARVLALARLKRWFRTAHENVEARHPDWIAKDGFLKPGLDVLVALAGIARLEGEQAAINYLRDTRYQENFGNLYAVNCMLLLRAWKLGLMRQDTWRNGVVDLLLQLAMSGLNETYLRIFDFLKEQEIDRNLRQFFALLLAQVPRDPEEVSLSLDIGRYADCLSFVGFVRNKEPDARIHF